MSTPALLIGKPNAILQNVVYALPARQVRLMSVLAIDTSIDNITWTTIAASVTGVDITAVFVRCAGGDTTVVVKV